MTRKSKNFGQVCLSGFPDGLENLENRRVFSSRGKVEGILIRLAKSGNFRQNTEKVWIFFKIN